MYEIGVKKLTFKFLAVDFVSTLSRRLGSTSLIRAIWMTLLLCKPLCSHLNSQHPLFVLGKILRQSLDQFPKKLTHSFNKKVIE